MTKRKSAKPKSATRKTQHRSAAGAEPVYRIRLPDKLIGEVERWATAHDASRAEAIQRLVELGLKAKRTRQPTPKAGARAAELAGQVIDSKADPAASPEERDQRKRRLLRGPSVFREMRKDKIR